MPGLLSSILTTLDSSMTLVESIEEAGAIHVSPRSSARKKIEINKSKSLNRSDDILDNTHDIMTTYKDARAQLILMISRLSNKLDPEYGNDIQKLAELILLQVEQVNHNKLNPGAITPHTVKCTNILIETNRFLYKLSENDLEAKDFKRFVNFSKNIITKEFSPPYRAIMGTALMLGGCALLIVGIKLAAVGFNAVASSSMELIGGGFKLFTSAFKSKEKTPVERKVHNIYKDISNKIQNLRNKAEKPRLRGESTPKPKVIKKPVAPIIPANQTPTPLLAPSLMPSVPAPTSSTPTRSTSSNSMTSISTAVGKGFHLFAPVNHTVDEESHNPRSTQTLLEPTPIDLKTSKSEGDEEGEGRALPIAPDI